MLYQKVLDFICQKLLENNFHFLSESTCRLQKIQKGTLFGPESPKELMEDIVFPIRIKEENGIIDMQRL